MESKERLADITARTECLQLAEMSLLRYRETGEQSYLDSAKSFAETAKLYSEMLKGDYVERDKKWAIYHKLENHGHS